MFDAIVIGVGSMGSAACYYLAKRKQKVLGIDQFHPPHELGSHTGQSRIIRQAYFEHPNYVPLLQQAYKSWANFEQETGEKLYYQTGLMYAGRADHPMMMGVKHSAELYQVRVDKVSVGDFRKRFSPFSIPDDFEILLEPNAGFITPEKTITCFKEAALQLGAHIHEGEKVISWTIKDNIVHITTNQSTYQSKKLVITAGVWTGYIAPMLQERIAVTRQLVAWLRPPMPNDYTLGKFPCWMIAERPHAGCYYGFPSLSSAEFGEPEGLKLAHHFPGEITEPDAATRDVTAMDIGDLERFRSKYLPNAGNIVASKTCLYANSPDEDFIIDKLPGFEDRVVVACGFSGHGFKFVPVVGEIISDLVISRETLLPIDFLSATRFNK